MENLKNIELLRIPESIKSDLQEFLNQILSLYNDDLISIMAFGSSVTGDYVGNTSDINFMVVYSDLNITDLDTVAALAQKWLKKRSFSPRFISMNNLINSSKYFQIDMLEMQDMHVTLFGKDLLNEIQIVKSNLHWQLSYEIKAMRMRIKQQFWKSNGDTRLMERILLERYTSIVHLSRVLLYLMNKPVATGFNTIMQVASAEIGIPTSFNEKMNGLKNKSIKFNQKEFITLFTELMDVIRIIDKQTDQIIL